MDDDHASLELGAPQHRAARVGADGLVVPAIEAPLELVVGGLDLSLELVGAGRIVAVDEQPQRDRQHDQRRDRAEVGREAGDPRLAQRRPDLGAARRRLELELAVGAWLELLAVPGLGLVGLGLLGLVGLARARDGLVELGLGGRGGAVEPAVGQARLEHGVEARAALPHPLDRGLGIRLVRQQAGLGSGPDDPVVDQLVGPESGTAEGVVVAARAGEAPVVAGLIEDLCRERRAHRLAVGHERELDRRARGLVAGIERHAREQVIELGALAPVEACDRPVGQQGVEALGRSADLGGRARLGLEALADRDDRPARERADGVDRHGGRGRDLVGRHALADRQGQDPPLARVEGREHARGDRRLGAALERGVLLAARQ
ncbi:hypothetical protein ENSA5_69440 [Enhygromyxa salina]|uniref:Uncharacterized protein n=1 Tax=Enhygromyxa salina TaxID=215803 RepID=A0A2S9XAR5_9BACT|nr:hypothetical protein ENSA5_69440 [Enhygromyxa salina]